MDKLQPYEISTLSKLLPWSKKLQYEQTRLMMWSSLAPYMKTKRKPEQILPLYTDKHKLYEEHEETLANDEADKIRAKIVTADWKKFQHKKY